MDALRIIAMDKPLEPSRRYCIPFIPEPENIFRLVRLFKSERMASESNLIREINVESMFYGVRLIVTLPISLSIITSPI